ncbi:MULTISPECIES: B12-binding domain-containing protein [unclassified Dehalobacter]|uniref:cobalamin B12-binding domain-containing protein n=1 Tax=unclassified Dehalobacter TaxID=2635733 RepID=UPI00036998B8|nr:MULTISPECIES: cobalamin-dependent protein [unclassified Dehalobacter]RJE48970.1 cobalamin-binding protein [Dehalobacter sp. MCB1]TCX50772.1 cobalamin-binding protein [Dehalobacter sp. 12DCB1]TCX51707.1 cobalamin-binding protein [Dehalobacter sp. 14DCB1]
MVDLKVLTQAMSDLDEDVLNKAIDEVLSKENNAAEVQEVVKACQQGMTLVGERYDSGEYFIGDLVFAGEVLQSVMDKLKPALSAGSSAKGGKIVLATVFGDLHDIGKNIFRSMVEAAGFEVIDLGINVPVSQIVDKVKEVNPDIVGLSGVLTLALDSMKETVDGLAEAGLRNSVKVIIGGVPVNEVVCKSIGADGFSTNAAEGVKICQRWVG